MKAFTHDGKDYFATEINGELVVLESGSWYNIPLTDKPKLKEMAANAVGGGGVDMAVNAGKRRMRDKVVRRWMSKWNQKNS